LPTSNTMWDICPNLHVHDLGSYPTLASFEPRSPTSWVSPATSRRWAGSVSPCTGATFDIRDAPIGEGGASREGLNPLGIEVGPSRRGGERWWAGTKLKG